MCMGSEFRSTYNFAKIGALFIIDERDRICIEKIKIPIFDGRFSEPGGWISSHHVSSCSARLPTCALVGTFLWVLYVVKTVSFGWMLIGDSPTAETAINDVPMRSECLGMRADDSKRSC